MSKPKSKPKSNRTQFQRMLIVIFAIAIFSSLDGLLVWIFDIKIPYWVGVTRTFVLMTMGYACCWYQWFWKWDEAVDKSVGRITEGLIKNNGKMMDGMEDKMRNEFEARHQREKEDWLRRN